VAPDLCLRRRSASLGLVSNTSPLFSSPTLKITVEISADSLPEPTFVAGRFDAGIRPTPSGLERDNDRRALPREVPGVTVPRRQSYVARAREAADAARALPAMNCIRISFSAAGPSSHGASGEPARRPRCRSRDAFKSSTTHRWQCRRLLEGRRGCCRKPRSVSGSRETSRKRLVTRARRFSSSPPLAGFFFILPQPPADQAGGLPRCWWTFRASANKRAKKRIFFMLCGPPSPLGLALPHEQAGSFGLRSRTGARGPGRHYAPLSAEVTSACKWRRPQRIHPMGNAHTGLIGGLGDRSAGQALDVGQLGLAPILAVRRFWPHGPPLRRWD